MKNKPKMTPEEMRVALARICGWTEKEVFQDSFSNPAKKVSRGVQWHSPNGHRTRIPELDHNLCAEALGRLSTEQGLVYVGLRQLKTGSAFSNVSPHKVWLWRFSKITPAEDAECIIRAWKGE